MKPIDVLKNIGNICSRCHSHSDECIIEDDIDYEKVYLEAQKRYASKNTFLRSKLSDVRSTLSKIDDHLDTKRNELSPELYSELHTFLREAWWMCWDYDQNFEEMYKNEQKSEHDS